MYDVLDQITSKDDGDWERSSLVPCCYTEGRACTAENPPEVCSRQILDQSHGMED